MQNQDLKRIIISPPFGKYLKFKETSNVYGSFTVNRRWGLIKQAIKTIRKIDKMLGVTRLVYVIQVWQIQIRPKEHKILYL